MCLWSVLYKYYYVPAGWLEGLYMYYYVPVGWLEGLYMYYYVPVGWLEGLGIHMSILNLLQHPRDINRFPE